MAPGTDVNEAHLPAVAEPLSATVMEKVLVRGDLSQLSPEERLSYYARVCESLGLNPLTQPFEYIQLNNKLRLYAKRDATDQLRALRKVSITIVGREKVGDVYAVTARASMPDGRTDESVGAVATAKLMGDALANALMKAETKAKRRVTLSIVGLGWLDETEIETIPGAKVGEPQPVKLGLVDVESEPSPAEPEWNTSDQVPEPDAPGDAIEPVLSKVKMSLMNELAAFSTKQRDALVRKYSQIVVDGQPVEGKFVESLAKMLSPAISDKWAAATLNKIREARKAKQGEAA